jgi:23S rRNA (guanosine2251-2'-O)-methyltransferase
LVIGWHAVQAVLTRHPERIRSLWLAEGRHDPRVTAIETLAQGVGLAIRRVSARELEARTSDVHQGVLAEIEPLPPWDEDQLITAVGEASAPLLLALDGVQDPHNLGACLRSADACGALAVIVPRDRAATLTASARKVAAGAAETTPLVTVTNLARCLRDLRQAGVWVVGADAGAERRAEEADLRGPTLLVMGAEGSGLRQLTRQHCDVLVRLPSLGAVESLNVSVATGMLLYEACRQRGRWL